MSTPARVETDPDPGRGRSARRTGSSLSRSARGHLVSSVLSLGIGAWIVISPPGGWVTLAALVIGLAVLWRTGTPRHQAIFMACALAAGIASVDYLAWRVQVLNTGALWLALPLLLAEAFGIVHSIGILYTLWPRPEPQLNTSEDPAARPIHIFIPTVNEGTAILRRTIAAAQVAVDRFVARYPQARVSIVVCNDGRVAGYPQWEDVENLARHVGVQCITRTVGGGAKAGNIEHARQLVGATGEALMVIFDADQIAAPEFLLATVPVLGDPTVGWVQTGQYYSNVENTVARWAEDQQAIFYRLLCPGKSRLNSAFICGTNVVLRARALDEIGGLPTDSVTEDFAASLRLHAGWRSVFVSGRLATGLGPMDLRSYFTQQRRWAIGTLSALRTNGREIFLSGGGLDRDQRLQYALASTHYLSGIKDLIFILSPVVFLLTGIPAVRGLTLSDFLWHFIPFLVFSQVAFWWYAARVTSIRGVLIGILSAPTLFGALVTAVSGRRVGFAVTAKAKSTRREWRYLLPHFSLLLLSVYAVVVSLPVLSPATALSVLWACYGVACLGASVWLGFRNSPRASRVQARAEGRALPRRTAIGWRRTGLAAGGVLLSALVVGCVAVYSLPRTTPVGFSASPDQGISYGVAAPGGAGPDSVPALDLSRAGIVGRHQLISDSFDPVWAQSLHAQGTSPWITLHFGSSRSDLGAGLLAIRNGTHDAELRRWAADLRDFRWPVYLTVLPFVDASWAETSARANGGTPQDVAPAWDHIRAVFTSAGASNVGFVWAPAFPDTDLTYAPAESDIDVVQLTVLHYAGGTSSADSATEARATTAAIGASLRILGQHHPGKPTLVEVGTSLPSGQKAVWLDNALRAISDSRGVVSVVYHEAPPDGDESWRSWSIGSDTTATQHWQALLDGSGTLTPTRR
ncbi:glycosyltransferase family 2 protein [Propionicimonas sp.]|uniref:glycosyltransferase family 2 protein n=1 Tax=Propionicimonas sp. TaxID=1955623 RepID=UPI0039E2797B